MHSTSDFSDYCLAYLLTNLDFDGTLGVAYVGGVCANHGRVTNAETHKSERKSINSGFITIRNPKYDMDEAEHTFAHEIGHNFGASHDIKLRCDRNTPKEYYLMAPLAPAYETSTSRKFSGCSLKAINRVLKEMKRGLIDWCFVKDKKVKKAVSPTVVTTRTPLDEGDVNSESWKNVGGAISGAILAVCFIVATVCVVYAYVEQRMCFGKKQTDFSKVQFASNRAFLHSDRLSKSIRWSTRIAKQNVLSRWKPRGNNDTTEAKKEFGQKDKHLKLSTKTVFPRSTIQNNAMQAVEVAHLPSGSQQVSAKIGSNNQTRPHLLFPIQANKVSSSSTKPHSRQQQQLNWHKNDNINDHHLPGLPKKKSFPDDAKHHDATCASPPSSSSSSGRPPLPARGNKPSSSLSNNVTSSPFVAGQIENSRNRGTKLAAVNKVRDMSKVFEEMSERRGS
jgi:hypothetical protein